jgi:tetratricopeptide (TPR) repeat protein
LSNLAAALRGQGQLAEARSLLEEALAITRETLGPDHQSIPGYQVNLARVYLAENDPSGAETLLRDALARQQRTSAAGDWRLAATQGMLGGLLARRGEYEAAEALLLDANRVLKDVPGRQGREAAATRESLVALYQELRRPESAARYRRSSQ